jgi:alpha-L-fucosidase
MLQPWFTDAKFGIFIHWGIYSRGDWSESWAMFHGAVDRDTYMAQRHDFTASSYDPQAWADLFKRAGAKYVVPTTKHHDGFALYDTKQNTLSSVHQSPARRDVMTPLLNAVRASGLKPCVYFSLIDWSHPDYATIKPKQPQPHNHIINHNRAIAYPQGAEDPAAWDRFIAFNFAQVKELCEMYQPAMIWFDGDWERDVDQWKARQLRDAIQQWAPGCIINSRLGPYGDYFTPEQAVPVLRPDRPWELCVTMNESWGYQKADKRYKSTGQLLRLLTSCCAGGGNMLLSIGPTNTGEIPPEQVERLEQIGNWLTINGEAIYGTSAGLLAEHCSHTSTMNLAGDTIYFFLHDRVREGVGINGLFNVVKRATVLSDASPLTTRIIGGAPWADVPGLTWIDVPDSLQERGPVVLKVELDGPVRLLRTMGDPHVMNATPQ